ncbi:MULTISPECIES: hypothetical protein [unclassified Nocardiopsis]|uniref:hypothetical protein n=1 Tax=unclassified Nocardiopsis TaxID=2649073 RepID=UPI00135978EA|nr:MULTISPECIES: hypothetical protein [unclassified Nocardiopsis]
MRSDLNSSLSIAGTLPPAARTATANGTGADITDFRAVAALVHIGAWVDGSHAFSLEESDDNTTFTAVDAGDLVGSLPTVTDATEDDTVHALGYFGTARYLRVVVTVTGSPATGLLSSASVIRGKSRTLPAS